jgi:hypothetical protein
LTNRPPWPKLAAMTGDDLTAAQLEAISMRIRSMLGYLNKLKRRMDANSFPADDELRLLVNDAEDAMHRLGVSVHTRSCAAVTRGKKGKAS